MKGVLKVNLEHPAITKVNRFGYLHEEEQTSEFIGECSYCEHEIYDDDQDSIRWNDYLYCDKECLEESYAENLQVNGHFRECF